MKIIIIVNVQLLTKIERQPESSNMLRRSPKSDSTTTIMSRRIFFQVIENVFKILEFTTIILEKGKD